ncbi:MAG: M16 family metallopeptidase [Dokdonella sp.]|uniref:M16 family metallopeptidase n=1 Tax=Dokdonella sp. TaxID=2291710 RepID=UPI003F81DD43
MRKPLAFLVATAALACGGVAAHAAGSDAIDIPFTRYTLPNGLTLVVSEDHKAPVVAVSVWYHVGSADEPAGKTGFAHLFEHLMFQGSENHKDEFFRPFELAGATDQNGTTWFDRTNYYETVPTTALDMTLWMESDRMGHLLGAIGQAELDEQRGVVQNEKRQGENQPYGRVDERLAANAFPANHPYHHDTIGSMKDLDAASLADVKQWFQAWYGAANVTISIVGDITPEAAKEKVQKYFGDIPAGAPVPRQQPWVAPRTESTRDTMTDRVAQTRIVREWNVPGLADADEGLLELAADVLGGGKTSRLYERLVYKDKLVDDVSVTVQAFALASMLQLTADVKNGVDPAKVEAAIAEEWAKFLEHGPTEDELARVKVDNRAHFIRALEKVNSKASVLAEGQVYRDDPAAYKQDLARMDAATPASVLAAAKRWIARGDYTLTISPAAKDDAGEPADEMEKPGRPALAGRPEPKLPKAPEHAFMTTPSSVDRSKGVPEVATFPDLSFPKIERGKLKNGIDIVLAQRHTIPVVQVQLLFDAGYASDQGRKLGTSAFTMAMLDEGTAELDSLEIARRAERLGAIIGAGSGLDSSNASLNALASQLEPSLKLFGDVVRNAAFRDADIARIRGQWLARIAQEKTQPTGLALRSLPPLLYGSGHAYAIPFTGSGTEASITSLDATDLRAYVRDFIRPDNVTILVAGDTTLESIVAKLDAVFGDWKAAGTPVPKKNIAHVGAPKKPRLFLLDKPGASQSLILAGVVAPSTKAKNNLEIQTMNGAFGGSFTSRLNMNLREAKHWAYGAGSFLSNAIGQRPFLMYAPVQTDKTAESVAEILREAKEIVGTRPLAHEEIDKIKVGDVRSLPGEYQTTGSVLGAITSMKLYDRPDDYVQTLKGRIEAQTDEAVQAAAREVVQPGALTWVVVGDLARIEQPLRKLELGEVEVIDADGKKVH